MEQYAAIQPMVQKDARDIATSVFQELSQASQYNLPKVPYHEHTGVDSPRIDYNNLINTPTSVSAFSSGMIQMYGGSSAPTGWLLCNGSAVSRSTYATLFAVIGTTYGIGDGSSTFNVPDLRGRSPIGAGTGTGGGASGSGLPTGGSSLTARSAGDWLGEETHTLITTEIPAHTHSEMTNGTNNSGSGPLGLGNNSGPISSGLNTGSTGGDGAHNNIQPVMTVNFIIKS